MRSSTQLKALHNLRRASNSKRVVRIGIRAEDPKRIWERRTPLTPEAVYELVSEGSVLVEVVSSPKRIFSDQEYRKAGATIVHALTDPEIILGIKEPPLSELFPSSSSNLSRQTHMMFSHTIKGQDYNMPLLAHYVAPSISVNASLKGNKGAMGKGGGGKGYPRLVDYELITGQDGKRSVGFGWFAGVAGVLESLSAMAHSHLEIGVASPFLYTPRPHTLPSLERLRAALREIGQTIAAQGTPVQLGPFIIGLTGTGQVAQGCLSMLFELPIEMVRVEDLDALMRRAKSSEADLRKIYLVHAKPEDYLVRMDGKRYGREHYYQSPQSYKSVFCDKIAPYLTLFLNGAGWSPSFPRLMTTKQLDVAAARAQALGGARFRNIGDISCDVNGGLEFLAKATTLSAPTITVQPSTPGLPPVQMMAVDILPASIPYDASVHFSRALIKRGYFRGLVEYHAGERVEVPRPLQQASVAVHGKLGENHEWLQGGVDRAYAASKEPALPEGKFIVSESGEEATTMGSGKKKILILGSGMVAGPAVDLIARRAEFDLVVAGDALLELERLVAPHHNVNYRIIDAGDLCTYSKLVEDADVVISLLPASMHVSIAKACLKGNTHLITASYMSPEMEELSQSARLQNLLILTEIGLDPGIDHCSAMEMLDKYKREGKHVLSFTSFCGGLPLPENSHVPLRYKFSWRPQGVLTAALNSATYLLGKNVHHVPGDRLLQSYWPDIPITSEFKLEGLPNRDSLAYKKHYHIFTDDVENKAHTIVRGTLRYPGFSSLMGSFAALGFLNNTQRISISAWPDFVDQCLIIKRDQGHDISLSALVPPENVDALRDAMEWLGLTTPSMITSQNMLPLPPVPQGLLTPLDCFAFLLSQKLKYSDGEQDMVVLSHEIITRGPGAHGAVEVHTSTLIEKGTLDHDVGARGQRPASAMARTVGLPAAIAAMLVAEGEIREVGVIRPTGRGVWAPIMRELRRVGVKMEEKTVLKSMKGLTVEHALFGGKREGVVGAAGGRVGMMLHGGEDLVISSRDLDGDRTWSEEEGVVVDPRNQY